MQNLYARNNEHILMNRSYHILWKKQDEKSKFGKDMVKIDKNVLRLERGYAIVKLSMEM